MKPVAAIVAAAITAAFALTPIAVAADKDCPKPVISIRGPCPQEVRCSNLSDLKCEWQGKPVACTPVPCEAVDCRAVDCRAVPCKERDPKVVVKYMDDPMHNGGGQWMLPLSVGWLPAHTFDVAWEESLVRGKPQDPALRVDSGHDLLLGAGIGYQFASRWIVMGQLLYVDRGDAHAAWSDKPDLPRYPRVRHGAPQASGDGGDFGIMATVVVPLGHK